MRLLSLFEGISATLYHLTHLGALGDILKNDKIRLSASFSNPSEEQAGSSKLFFLSTTRSFIGGYTLRSLGNGSAVLVLDGKKLAHNYSGSPVDYWGPRMKATNFTYDEMEDRVYSDKPYIDNISNYIKEIHALVLDKITMRQRKAILEIKKSHIPLYLYDNEKDFLARRNPKPLQDFELDNEKPYSMGYDSISARKVFNRGENDRRGFALWNYLLTVPVEKYDSMGYKTKDHIRDIVVRGKDAFNYPSFMADLHNAKNSPRELQTLVSVMKKNKLRNSDDVWQFLINRWEPVVNRAN